MIPRKQTLIGVGQESPEEISICLRVGDCPVERDSVVLVPDRVRSRVEDSDGSLSGGNKGEGESGEAGKHGEYGFGRCWILYDAIYVRNVKRTRTKCAGRNVRTWLCTPPYRSWHIRCLRRWG